MKIAFFDSHQFDQICFEKENKNFAHDIIFLTTRLTEQSAALASGCVCVCAFVNDTINRTTLEILAKNGTRLIALRCAGYNHVDLASAKEFGIKIVRVPEYSPHAVAEHAVALILSLNRKIHRAYNRVREGNFSLEGLVGFDLFQKKVGVIGTGRIGAVLSQILLGFGCTVLAYDKVQNPELVKAGVQYADLEEIFKTADIVSLHVPLNPETHHLINEKTLSLMKRGVMLINTGRGGLVDTPALIAALKTNHVGSAGLDVYEEEEGVFFQDFSAKVLQDDQLARLLTFNNVLLTSHQAFLTHEALQNIAATTLTNISIYKKGLPLQNEVGLS